MLRIGFSTKYFTLWDVKETIEWTSVGGLNLPYQKISYCYIQNLSMDENEAKRKAIFKGVENFEIDHDLFGRNASFFHKKELFSKIPSDKSYFFEFGKFQGEPIKNCTDLDYLFWYFNESQNIHAKAILLENGFVEFEGQVVHDEHTKKIKLRELVVNEIKEKKEIEVEVLSNLTSVGEFRFSIKNEVFYAYFFGNSKQMYYNGITYFLPIINGKAKRFKGKSAKLTIEKINGDWSFEINKIEIL